MPLSGLIGQSRRSFEPLGGAVASGGEHSLAIVDDVRRREIPQEHQAVRFLLCRDETPVGAVEVLSLERPEAQAVEEKGPQIESFSSTIDVLERTQAVSQRSFQLRALRIPALYVTAVWLHANDEDYISVLDPAFPPFRSGLVYSFQGFIDLAAERAGKKAVAADTGEKIENDAVPNEATVA